MMRAAVVRVALALLAVTTPTACSTPGGTSGAERPPTTIGSTTRADGPVGRPKVVTLAFAGDMHFELYLDALLNDGSQGLGPMRRSLAGADVAMVNLESAITERGTPDPKRLETSDDRYWFRASPAALTFLADAGVDVVTMANNHAADYGPVGLADTLRAAARAPVAVVGVGRDRAAAFAPYRVTVHATDLAFLAADASPREGSSTVWAAGPRSPGVAAAREPVPGDLLAAVRRASQEADVVVVYLHWGREGRACPTSTQRTAARAVSAAGADVIVGSHAHVLLGSGWQQDTYVNYGLGNFLWYRNAERETGVLRLRVEDGQVVADDWVPAVLPTWDLPEPVLGPARRRAVADWRQLRGCAGLAARPTTRPAARLSDAPGYHAAVRRIGPSLRARMAESHRPGCPTGWSDLRHLRLPYVGFDGREHTGELVVAARWARPVVGVFARLHAARWPIRRMRLVDEYGGVDDRSMAADNTSAYNCRRVAGTDVWSDHAYGTAIDLNPVRNPYLVDGDVAPPRGRSYADLDRSARASVPRGVIHADDVVVRAFADIGWEWGGTWASPDYQHFSAPESG